jgi:hypothetical protein
MIKKTLAICIIGILLFISGCSDYTVSRTAQGSGDVRPASLGGICLGDSPEDVIKILGKEYTEDLETDDSGYIGEDIITWSFNKGIVVKFGKESNKVIRVVSQSTDFGTDLGIKIDDEARIVFEKYKPEFKEVISRHSNETVPGWFHIDDE